MKQRQENKDWKPATHGHYWNQVASATTTALAKMTGSKEHELSSAMALERETWMLSQLDIMDAKMKCKEPLKLTPELTSQIQRLPEKDVTLYIKLDEEIPANSCTVYQVDMQRFHQDRHRPDGVKRCDKLFRYFKICSKKNVLDRNDAIAGTLASASFMFITLSHYLKSMASILSIQSQTYDRCVQTVMQCFTDASLRIQYTKFNHYCTCRNRQNNDRDRGPYFGCASST